MPIQVQPAGFVNESPPLTFIDLNNSIARAYMYAMQNDMHIGCIYAGRNQLKIIRSHIYPLTLDDVMRKKEGAQMVYRENQIYEITDQPSHWLIILIPNS